MNELKTDVEGCYFSKQCAICAVLIPFLSECFYLRECQSISFWVQIKPWCSQITVDCGVPLSICWLHEENIGAIIWGIPVKKLNALVVRSHTTSDEVTVNCCIPSSEWWLNEEHIWAIRGGSSWITCRQESECSPDQVHPSFSICR